MYVVCLQQRDRAGGRSRWALKFLTAGLSVGMSLTCWLSSKRPNPYSHRNQARDCWHGMADACVALVFIVSWCTRGRCRVEIAPPESIGMTEASWCRGIETLAHDAAAPLRQCIALVSSADGGLRPIVYVAGPAVCISLDCTVQKTKAALQCRNTSFRGQGGEGIASREACWLLQSLPQNGDCNALCPAQPPAVV